MYSATYEKEKFFAPSARLSVDEMKVKVKRDWILDLKGTAETLLYWLLNVSEEWTGFVKVQKSVSRLLMSKI
nr:hypothetical protein BaRGS_026306 [Batillaria attramentaria]